MSSPWKKGPAGALQRKKQDILNVVTIGRQVKTLWNLVGKSKSQFAEVHARIARLNEKAAQGQLSLADIASELQAVSSRELCEFIKATGASFDKIKTLHLEHHRKDLPPETLEKWEGIKSALENIRWLPEFVDRLESLRGNTSWEGIEANLAQAGKSFEQAFGVAVDPRKLGELKVEDVMGGAASLPETFATMMGKLNDALATPEKLQHLQALGTDLSATALHASSLLKELGPLSEGAIHPIPESVEQLLRKTGDSLQTGIQEAHDAVAILKQLGTIPDPEATETRAPNEVFQQAFALRALARELATELQPAAAKASQGVQAGMELAKNMPAIQTKLTALREQLDQIIHSLRDAHLQLRLPEGAPCSAVRSGTLRTIELSLQALEPVANFLKNNQLSQPGTTAVQATAYTAQATGAVVGTFSSLATFAGKKIGDWRGTNPLDPARAQILFPSKAPLDLQRAMSASLKALEPSLTQTPSLLPYGKYSVDAWFAGDLSRIEGTRRGQGSTSWTVQDKAGTPVYPLQKHAASENGHDLLDALYYCGGTNTYDAAKHLSAVANSNTADKLLVQPLLRQLETIDGKRALRLKSTGQGDTAEAILIPKDFHFPHYSFVIKPDSNRRDRMTVQITTEWEIDSAGSLESTSHAAQLNTDLGKQFEELAKKGGTPVLRSTVEIEVDLEVNRGWGILASTAAVKDLYLKPESCQLDLVGRYGTQVAQAAEQK